MSITGRNKKRPLERYEDLIAMCPNIFSEREKANMLEIAHYMECDLRGREIFKHKKAVALVERYHKLGYDTYQKFCNAVLAVHPDVDYANVWGYFEMQYVDFFLGVDIEEALNTLHPTA